MPTLEQRLVSGAKNLAEAEIAAAEERLGHKYPPGFRALLQKHGAFKLRRPGSDDAVFEVWPLDEHRTALARAADELECEPTASEVSEQLGLSEESVAVLEKIILVGAEGHEDFVGFDLRTANPATHEATFVLQLMDDTEIEYLAENPGSAPDRAPGFEAWLEDHARRWAAE